MKEDIPTTPELLTWARRTAGYDIPQVVEKLNRKTITAETIENWEKGKGSPSYPCLKKLAYEIYNRPLALFFFPYPPDEEEPRKSFRTLSDELLNSISPKMRFLLRKAKVRQYNLKELSNGVNVSSRLIWKAFPLSEAKAWQPFCKKLREFIGVPLEKQNNWRDSEEALKGWRDAIEARGIYVFKESFKEDDTSGFCLYDEQFPVIYINNNKAKNRQIFTLFHELAHILLYTGGLDLVDFRGDSYLQKLNEKQRKLEIKCNAFAAHFLVPDQDFKNRIINSRVNERVLKELADHYSVSREVILRKFLDRKLISQSEYNRTVKAWYANSYKKKAQDKAGGNFYANKNIYLGKSYLNLAFSCYYQNRISERQLADYLELNNQEQIANIELHLLK